MSSLSASQIDQLPDHIIEAAARAWEDEKEKITAREYALDVLANGTDDEVIKWGEGLFMGYGQSPPPITLANRYDNVQTYQEFSVKDIGHWHPRRPVFMKGARQCLFHAYSSSGWGSNGCANSWAAHVFRRAVKMAKITALSQTEWEDRTKGIEAGLKERHRLTYHFGNMKPKFWGRPWDAEDDRFCYIGGREFYLSASEFSNIKALRGIIAKTDNLDKRKAQAIAHMKRRLS